MKSTRFLVSGLSAAALATGLVLTPVLTQAQAGGDGIGSPQYTREAGPSVSVGASTVPIWASSFTYGGQTYPFTMVGTDPAKNSTTSTVPTEIIPMQFVFANGDVLDGSTKTALTVASPIFQNAGFDSGSTQYGDAMQRAEFWTTGGSNGAYHVLLGQPQILGTQTINVPKEQGQVVIGSRSGRHIGLMSYSWFTAQLKNLLGQLHISSLSTPIFLTYNTFLYQHSTSNCCILGYHGASGSANGNGKQPVQTYIFAAYSDPGIFSSSFIQDIHGLSHEVSEFLNDPFANNAVPPWSVPSAPQYGCTSVLETGDPLVGYGFTVGAYHPQDVAYYSWFARETPSRALGGKYDYLGLFTSVAPGC